MDRFDHLLNPFSNVQRNPVVREILDDLTGTRVRPGVTGATSTGKKVMRIRPAQGQPVETLPVDPDTLDPSRDTFGVDPKMTAMYRKEAQALARARKKAGRRAPFKPGTELNLGKIGASTTFSSPKAAAKSFMAENESLFEHPLFDDLDLHDTTKDFMDGIEVLSGKKHVRLSKTRRGEQILAAGARSGSAIASEMIAYLFGMAGNRRRWRNVPWRMVDAYADRIRVVMDDEAERQGTTGGGAITWYPLASGVYADDEMLGIASEQLGVKKAQMLADWMNSQELFEIVERFARVLDPEKGERGASARKIRRCIPTELRKIIRHRLQVVRHWAQFPNEIPDWACAPSAEVQQRAAVCIFPGLREDLARVERACEVPYDPSWPASERDMGRGEHGTGIMPLEEVAYGGNETFIDEPWETAAENPSKTSTREKVARLLNPW